jgi:hypothetical protein
MKRESFDHSYIRKFAPNRFDQFALFPSVGSSGGIITIWNGALFHGQVIESTSFVVHIKFTSDVSGQCWQLLNIYGPCAGDTREIFVQWMMNLEIPDDELWLLAGDLTSTDQKKTEIGRVETYRICALSTILLTLTSW